MSDVRGASLSGKERLYRGHALRLFPVIDRVRGHCSSPEQEAEEIEDQIEEEPVRNASLAILDPHAGHKKHKHHRGDYKENRRLSRPRPSSGGQSTHRQPFLVPACSAATESRDQGGVTGKEKGPANKPLTSKVPLKLQIKVCSQRGSLGISIAGGKGSSPYKENDEGIFISRVSKGGPAEKAGVHKGDRVLEVNGLNMQHVTHHEAVSALRHAGSCIKMMLLRERTQGSESPDHDDSSVSDTESIKNGQHDSQEVYGHNHSAQGVESGSQCSPAARRGTIVCNGNGAGLSGSEDDLRRSTSDTEASITNHTLPTVKNTMTIPRIILTHPSTSDEDVEQLMQDPEDEELDELGSPDSPNSSECLNSAFYPP
ncbi:uncharacterized protein LOC136718969 [Amia ocellicauda]|uniref:uncharacterized protein LOC136718969 n=1 Tax=Amia ocellicauda TaxID=2972642 RepID=UPI003463F3C7